MRLKGLYCKACSCIAKIYSEQKLHTLQGPVFISLAAFTVYGALGYQLTAAVAFPCLSLFNLLRFPLMMLPEQILNVIQGKVALSRIQKFMNVRHHASVPMLETVLFAGVLASSEAEVLWNRFGSAG